MAPVRERITQSAYLLGKNDVTACLKELEKLGWLSQDEVAARQRREIENLLQYVNEHVPYYQDLFKQIGFHPSDFAADPACFSQLPTLSKQMVRQNFDRLVTTDPRRKEGAVKVKTGGTTGEPMWLMYDQAYRSYNTAHVYQEMIWAGWHLGQPQAWLWGHPVVGAGAKIPLLKQAKDWLANRIESNAFHITDKSLEHLTVQLERQPNAQLWSYVSTMYRFAQFLQQRGHRIRLQAAHTAAEPLYDDKRAFIEQVLGCKVFNSYSCVEIGSIAAECEQHNGLHLRTHNCYLEVLRDGRPVSAGEKGEFVLTNLINYGFPLIRYKVEDWGRKSVAACPCGRGLPLLQIVEGRTIDHFKTRDGRLVWGAFVIPMVPLLGPIVQYQIVQETVDRLAFRIIPAGPMDEARFADIQQAVKKVLGENVEARLEFVDSLPQTPTGKHCYTVSRIE